MASILKKISSRRWSGNRLVAVDFDSRQLRIVQSRRQGDRMRVTKMNCTPMPEGMDIADPKAVGEFLARTLKSMHLGSSGLVMSVPRGQAVLNSLTLPPGTPPSEFAGMVQFQMEKELAFRQEEAVIDYTTESHYDVEAADGEAVGESVLAGAVRLPVVDYYRQIALSAGAKLHRLGLRPYADRRCAEACTLIERDARVLLVHITADETEISVLRNGALEFSRSAVVSVPAPGEHGGEAVEALVREVSRSLQSYQAEQAGEISKILLAGGTGIEALAADALADGIGVHCELLNPAVALGLAEDSPGTSSFLSALGLAISRAEDEPLPFDFLNPKRPPIRRDMKKRRMAMIAGAAALVVVGSMAFGWVKLGEKNARVASLRRDKSEKGKGSKRDRAIEKQRDGVEEWVGQHRDYLGHWAQLSCLFPECETTYVTSLKADSGAMTFTVRATDTEVMADLDRRLVEAAYDSKPSTIMTRPDPFGYQYGTTLKVIIGPDVTVDLTAVEPAPRPADDIAGSTKASAGGSSSYRPGSNGGSSYRPGSSGGSLRPAPSKPTPTPPAPRTEPNRPPKKLKDMTDAQRRVYEARMKEYRDRKKEEDRLKKLKKKGGGR